jgi:hypothetical protein
MDTAPLQGGLHPIRGEPSGELHAQGACETGPHGQDHQVQCIHVFILNKEGTFCTKRTRTRSESRLSYAPDPILATAVLRIRGIFLHEDLFETIRFGFHAPAIPLFRRRNHERVHG